MESWEVNTEGASEETDWPAKGQKDEEESISRNELYKLSSCHILAYSKYFVRFTQRYSVVIDQRHYPKEKCYTKLKRLKLTNQTNSDLVPNILSQLCDMALLLTPLCILPLL